MTRPSDNLAELRTLLDALCEESITAEQMQRLEQLVLADPEAEAYYVQFMSLHADLIGHFGVLPARAEQSLWARAAIEAPQAEPAQPAPGEVVQLPRRGRRRWPFLLGGALGVSGLAAALLLVFVLGHRSQPVRLVPGPSAEPEDDSVAVLLQAPGAEWEATYEHPRAGDAIAAGRRLHLRSGFAHIEFYSGVTVILEGPADFELVSRTEAYCRQGKLRASVPSHAQGFTINTPDLDLVDRGTEFGLQVGADQKAEVHVFNGEVELHDRSPKGAAAPRQQLTTGQGVRMDRPGKFTRIKVDPSAFRTAGELAKRRQQDWLAASEALRKDPSLLVYYTFQTEQPWSRTVLDQVAVPRLPRDGAVVGCSWAPGRWPGKQGLEFKRLSDRVRLSVPGQFDSLTLMAWVRVDDLPNRFNSLFMTDSWDDGEPHWHIGNDGKIELGVQGPGRKGFVHYFSPEVFSADRLGQWVHLAVVHGPLGGSVIHYVDGKPVSEEPVQLDIPLRIGDAEIGNWNVTTRPHRNPIRYFTGCMDEFMLFSRALSGEDIEAHYAKGRPPS